jgi:hypothetical protein
MNFLTDSRIKNLKAPNLCRINQFQIKLNYDIKTKTPSLFAQKAILVCCCA